jgi:hypothetical protein
MTYANSQCWNSILPGDVADIAVKHFLDIFVDHRPAFCGREHHVNQATCVTVRHGYSREFVLPVECTQDECPGIFSAVPGGTVPGSYVYPGLASWATISRPFGTGFSLHIPLPALRGVDYSQPSPSGLNAVPIRTQDSPGFPARCFKQVCVCGLLRSRTRLLMIPLSCTGNPCQ